MEACECSALELMQQLDQPLSEDAARAVLGGVLRGLVHLHGKHGIIHRDVKASNVLLSAAGGAKPAAAPCVPGCDPVCPRLRPRVSQAATPCVLGCDPVCPRLRPCVSQARPSWATWAWRRS